MEGEKGMGFDPSSENFKKTLEKYHSKPRYSFHVVLAIALMLGAGYLTFNTFSHSQNVWSSLIAVCLTQLATASVVILTLYRWWIFNFEGYELIVRPPSHSVQIIYRGGRGQIVHDFGHLELDNLAMNAPSLIFPLGSHGAFHVPPATNFMYGFYDLRLRHFTLEEENFKFVGTLTQLVELVRSYPDFKSIDARELLLQKSKFAEELLTDIQERDERLRSYEEVTRLILSITQAIEECLNGTRFHSSEEARKLIESQMRALEGILKALPKSSQAQALDLKLQRLKETLSKKSRLTTLPSGN